MRVLIKCIAGSHLFGTNGVNSDKDFKGVYLPEAKEILLGTIQTSVHQHTNNSNTKNTKDDIDVEYYSLDKYLRMLEQGQTVALEILFTPDSCILEKDPLWDEIFSDKSKFVHKQVTAFIGYAKQQANKYGIKGSRMKTMKNALELLKYCPRGFDITLGDMWNSVEGFVKVHEHTSIMNLPANKNMNAMLIPHWEICGRKFDKTIKTDHLIDTLTTIFGNYGERSLDAMDNKNIDFKAVSHALRVCHQGQELLNTGKITLPLESTAREYITKVKNKELNFAQDVQPKLELEMEKLKEAEISSQLPKNLDKDFINDIIVKVYSDVVKGV